MARASSHYRLLDPNTRSRPTIASTSSTTTHSPSSKAMTCDLRVRSYTQRTMKWNPGSSVGTTSSLSQTSGRRRPTAPAARSSARSTGTTTYSLIAAAPDPRLGDWPDQNHERGDVPGHRRRSASGTFPGPNRTDIPHLRRSQPWRHFVNLYTTPAGDHLPARRRHGLERQSRQVRQRASCHFTGGGLELHDTSAVRSPQVPNLRSPPAAAARIAGIVMDVLHDGNPRPPSKKSPRGRFRSGAADRLLRSPRADASARRAPSSAPAARIPRAPVARLTHSRKPLTAGPAAPPATACRPSSVKSRHAPLRAVEARQGSSTPRSGMEGATAAAGPACMSGLPEACTVTISNADRDCFGHGGGHASRVFGDVVDLQSSGRGRSPLLQKKSATELPPRATAVGHEGLQPIFSRPGRVVSAFGQPKDLVPRRSGRWAR